MRMCTCTRSGNYFATVGSKLSYQPDNFKSDILFCNSGITGFLFPAVCNSRETSDKSVIHYPDNVANSFYPQV